MNNLSQYHNWTKNNGWKVEKDKTNNNYFCIMKQKTNKFKKLQSKNGCFLTNNIDEANKMCECANLATVGVLYCLSNADLENLNWSFNKEELSEISQMSGEKINHYWEEIVDIIKNNYTKSEVYDNNSVEQNKDSINIVVWADFVPRKYLNWYDVELDHNYRNDLTRQQKYQENKKLDVYQNENIKESRGR